MQLEYNNHCQYNERMKLFWGEKHQKSCAAPFLPFRNVVFYARGNPFFEHWLTGCQTRRLVKLVFIVFTCISHPSWWAAGSRDWPLLLSCSLYTGDRSPSCRLHGQAFFHSPGGWELKTSSVHLALLFRGGRHASVLTTDMISKKCTRAVCNVSTQICWRDNKLSSKRRERLFQSQVQCPNNVHF